MKKNPMIIVDDVVELLDGSKIAGQVIKVSNCGCIVVKWSEEDTEILPSSQLVLVGHKIGLDI